MSFQTSHSTHVRLFMLLFSFYLFIFWSRPRQLPLLPCNGVFSLTLLPCDLSLLPHSPPILYTNNLPESLPSQIRVPMPYGLFGIEISISAILKISFLKLLLLKSQRHLVKYVKKFFFFFFFLSNICYAKS
jgi:hypothetical protein